MRWRRHNVDVPDGTGRACCPVASVCLAPPSVVPHSLLCPVSPLIVHRHWLAAMPARRTSKRTAPARPISPHNPTTEDISPDLATTAPEDAMGPPQAPATGATPNPSQGTGDTDEKYRRLKRRYYELDEKHKETEAELQLSSERNTQLRKERGLLLDRIIELENSLKYSNNTNEAGQDELPFSSAYPRALFSSRARSSFTSHLRRAMAEVGTSDLMDDQHNSTSQRYANASRKPGIERTFEPKRSARYSHPSLPEEKGKRRETPADISQSVRVPVPGSSLDRSIDPALTVNDLITEGARQRVPSSQSPPLRHSPTYYRAHTPLSPSLSYTIIPPGSPIIYPGSYSLGPASSPIAYTLTSSTAQNAHIHPHGHQSRSPVAELPFASQPPTNGKSGKPKRLKAHTVTSKSHNIPTVPRDKQGRPLLPLTVGIMTVISLGEVCVREHFHTERYIFPVGYEVTRRYLSMVDPSAEVVYHCTIIDGEDGPKFQIVPSDTPDQPIIAGTATGAWSVVVKRANYIRNRQHSNSVSGPDFFGLGQNTIKHLIQELPGANRLRDYVWQNFIEGGPLGGRHAAVQPAVPEDQETVQPIGPYYPTPRELSVQRPQREDSEPPPWRSPHLPSVYPSRSSPPSRHPPPGTENDRSYPSLGSIAHSPPHRRRSFVAVPELSMREYQPPSSLEPPRKRAKTMVPPPPLPSGDVVRHRSSASSSPHSLSPLESPSTSTAAPRPRTLLKTSNEVSDGLIERGGKKRGVPPTLAGLMNAYSPGVHSSTRSASDTPPDDNDDDDDDIS